MDGTILIVLGLLLVATVGVWVVLGGRFRTSSRGTPEGQWDQEGRVGSLASPPLLLVSAIGGVGVAVLLAGVLLARI